jgi:hypothetical protein
VLVQAEDTLVSDSPQTTDEYNSFLQSLKERIQSAQVRAALAVNGELVTLYWQIGHEILVEQSVGGVGVLK